MTVAAANHSNSPLRGTAWASVFMLATVLFGGALMRIVFAPLQEATKLDLKLSDFSISLVQGLATGAPVAVVSIPLAWVIDHGHRMRLLIILFAICVVGTLWTTFVAGFWSLFFARLLASLGATCAIPVIVSLVADMCAPDRRGRAIIVLGLGTYIGSAAGFVLGGVFLAQFAAHPIAALGNMVPWRATHLVVGLAGGLLLFPLFMLREPERHETELANPSLADSARAVWAKRRFLLPLFVGQIGVVMADTAASIWASPVLIRNFHQQPAQFSAWIGGIILVGGILGSVVGGLSADWGHKTGRRGMILIGAVIAAALGIPAALFPVMPGAGGFAALFLLLVLSGTIAGVVASTAVAVLIPNEERGACMAAFSVINSLIGMSLAPSIVTLGSWAMGGEQHLAASLAMTGIVTGVLSLIGYFFAMKNAPLKAIDA